jgi:hypothetical protein
MGITLGWVALLLAGATGAPPEEKHTAPISYTVRMVEAEGVGWRAAAMSHLKPVTRQGAATVWTVPKNTTKTLIVAISKESAAGAVQAPRVTALPGVPAAIQVRENRKFVTQVAWNGDEGTPEGTPEEVRIGWHTTLIGRKLDQGILVKMVFEDTEIRGVHQVTFPPGADARPSNANTPTSTSSDGEVKAAGLSRSPFEQSPFWTASSPKTSIAVAACCKEETAHTDCPTFACCIEQKARAENRILELPEVANQEILGEWLIPKGECLLVSFGPHTVADKNGKAVVRERLAFVEADEQPGDAGTSRAVKAARSYFIPPAPAPMTAPAPFGVVATPRAPAVFSVPYSSNGKPIYGVPPAPAPIAPPMVYGPTSVPAPEVPLPSGRYMHDDVQYLPLPQMFPLHESQGTTQPAPMRATGVQPPPSSAAPTPAAPVRPADKMPTPAAPSRSFPEGIHADGSKAKLPPLPEDEMEDDSADSESAEPRPSPQTKKPRKPEPKPEPEVDETTTKVSFTKPKSSTVFLPSLFLPGSSVGFQFLLPISPFSLKLPFNQRLEIELFGRVVPDARSAEVEK